MNKTTILELNMIDMDLSPRDREILNLLQRIRFMRTDQICRLFFQEPEGTERAKLSRTTRCLHRLEKWGVIAHMPRKVRPNRGGTYGLVWYLTETGMRVLDLGKTSKKRSRPYEPSMTFLEHTLTVAEIYTDTVTLTREKDGMRLLTAEIEGEAARTHVKPATYLSGSIYTKIWPDMFLCLEGTYENGNKYRDYWYIEVDLGTERSKAITEKCLRYIEYYRTGQAQAKYNLFPGVLFVVADKKRKEFILSTISKLENKGLQKMFAVVTFEEYPEKLVQGLVV